MTLKKWKTEKHFIFLHFRSFILNWKIMIWRKLGHEERERGWYGEDEAIRARFVEVEGVKEICGEVGDGLDFRFEEKPGSPQSLRQLWFGQNASALELQTNPHALHWSSLRVQEQERLQAADFAAMCCFRVQTPSFLKPSVGFHAGFCF